MIKEILIIGILVLLTGCIDNSFEINDYCEEYKIKIIANIEVDYDETDRYVES